MRRRTFIQLAGGLLMSTIAPFRARAEAYRRCRNVVVPNLRYRADIGERFLARDRDLMVEWGWWPAEG